MRLRNYTLPDWYMVAGETKAKKITLRDDESGRPFELDGATVTLTIMDFVNYEANPLVLNDSTYVGIDAIGAGTDSITVSLTPNITAGEYGKYIYQLNITDALGNVTKPRGVLYIAHG